MIYINITNFVLISSLEKDRSMIETRRLKNVVIFIHTILNFVLSRKIINIANYCDIFIMITKIIVTIKILKLLSLLLLVLFIYIHIYLFSLIYIYTFLSYPCCFRS